MSITGDKNYKVLEPCVRIKQTTKKASPKGWLCMVAEAGFERATFGLSLRAGHRRVSHTAASAGSALSARTLGDTAHKKQSTGLFSPR